ncbi:MAG: cobaltochelatase subunit CobN, partial [Rhizobiaceae bacterium]
MHLLATSTATLDDLIEPIDLAQQPAEMVVLSFSDSDLSAVAAAWRTQGAELPTLRLAALRDLRHPMSVDLWLDTVAAQAKVILVRVLGGYEWWRYGCDRLSELARRKGIQLALLPGECREHDERLSALSTLGQDELSRLLACFREGGPDNMAVLLTRMARLAGQEIEAPEAREVPKAGFWLPDRGMCDLESVLAARPEGAPCVPILFYRSMLLAADIAPVEALCAELAAREIFAAPIFVSSLKDSTVARFIEDACPSLAPSLMISTTAFASGAEPGAETSFDRIGVPVFQAVVATTRRQAWESGERGLAPADLAMHVVLPELDGRVLAGAISFKDVTEIGDGLDFRGQINRPEPDRVAAVAERVARLIRLQSTPPHKRNVTILIPDYPAATGRTGYAVGLDVPQSVLAMLHDLKDAGYHVDAIPETARDLLRMIDRTEEGIAAEDYALGFDRLPETARQKVIDTWGALPSPLWGGSPEGRGGGNDDCPQPSSPPPRLASAASQPKLADPPHKGEGKMRFRAARFGNVTVALAPDRGRSDDRRVDYHDPSLAPRHELIAFGAWLREELCCHAIVHVGAHGTLEWLPGKTVALSKDCFPEIVTGGLPVVYPFIVSNPGEAAQAKRRIAAITIGHLPPPLTGAGLSDDQQKLERLVDEYAQADGLDRRRRDRLGQLIVETARRTGLAKEAGIDDADAPDEALMRIDAWLCDLKDFAIKDGLHVYGRA